MRHWSRWTGGVSALLGLSSLSRVPAGYGIVLAGVKFLSTALAPWIALLGGLSFWQGLRRRDRVALVTGLTGLVSAGYYTQTVLKPRDPLAAAFGPQWRESLAPRQRERLKAVLRPVRQVRWQRDLTIGTAVTGAPLRADLWLPPAAITPSGVGLVFLHGSSWYYFDKDLFSRSLFRRLAGQGHVILDLAYTLAPQADLADMLDEVRQAVRWMKTTGPQFGVNPERVVLGGGSAGGHLALLAAYTAAAPEQRVRGVISWYGVSELLSEHEHLRRLSYLPAPSRSYRLWTWLLHRLRILRPENTYTNAADLLPRLLGTPPYSNFHLYEAWSPLSYVGPDSPPTLLLHGQRDSFVPVEQSRYLYAALRANRVPVGFLEVPYADHDFDLLAAEAGNPAFRAALPVVAGFLALMARPDA